VQLDRLVDSLGQLESLTDLLVSDNLLESFNPQVSYGNTHNF